MENEKLIDWLSEGSIAIPMLLLNYYKKLGLDEEQFMLLLHVYSSLESGNSFPTPKELSEKMTTTEMRCMELLKFLIQRGFLQIEENHENEIFAESYSLRPLWEKLVFFLLESNSKQKRLEKEQEELNLFTIFEQEFGRPLSPIECENITMWLDHDEHDPLIIKAALREAVLSGKLNFRYIDRILLEWKKKGIKTIEQAREQGIKFRNHQRSKQQTQAQQTTTAVPFYNWLDS
ncbi:DnaD domain-containing protein [Calidifontibacillus oryziterrae]|uniref:DnaD domain-containing protein n=1 Tax=Calidifontibacillus oryziterrae TaxID=1191699 RepID=UPI0002DDABCE|nr:DnaD domain-containing protein [Calidifontibacillus oryziterrae]